MVRIDPGVSQAPGPGRHNPAIAADVAPKGRCRITVLLGAPDLVLEVRVFRPRLRRIASPPGIDIRMEEHRQSGGTTNR